jgi:hypothetical protein
MGLPKSIIYLSKILFLVNLMQTKDILYFDETGEANTDETLNTAKIRAEELGIKDIIVASTRGTTALKILEVFHGFNVVVIPHVTGMREPG